MTRFETNRQLTAKFHFLLAQVLYPAFRYAFPENDLTITAQAGPFLAVVLLRRVVPFFPRQTLPFHIVTDLCSILLHPSDFETNYSRRLFAAVAYRVPNMLFLILGYLLLCLYSKNLKFSLFDSFVTSAPAQPSILAVYSKTSVSVAARLRCRVLLY